MVFATPTSLLNKHYSKTLLAISTTPTNHLAYGCRITATHVRDKPHSFPILSKAKSHCAQNYRKLPLGKIVDTSYLVCLAST